MTHCKQPSIVLEPSLLRRDDSFATRSTCGTSRKRGAVMILVVLVSVMLLAFSAIAVQGVLARSVSEVTQRQVFRASQIAESALARAVAEMKYGGVVVPRSGSGVSATWQDFDSGELYYYTTVDAAAGTSVVRAWGRVAAAATRSNSTAAPDAVTWDGSGWVVRGVEVAVRDFAYFPESPLFVGNGGIERPEGGFDWNGTDDLANPSTWGTVTGSPSSYQSSAVPMVLSSLDHPADYLYGGSEPPVATAFPHPFSLWTSQNGIGQHNVDAWFRNSAGASDETSGLSPPPSTPYYLPGDLASPDHPYPVDPQVPDVQSYAWALWNSYGTATGTNRLGSGSHSGTFGDLANPSVTFVTGRLRVDSGETFRGAGILVVRDDYDPNTQTNNLPSTKADFEIRGTFEWTGLVIVSGWAPAVTVDSGGSATVVGGFFGEDSVQSGGEVSLDSATIIFRINDEFRVLYSGEVFRPGGMVHDFLPRVGKEVVGIRQL